MFIKPLSSRPAAKTRGIVPGSYVSARICARRICVAAAFLFLTVLSGPMDAIGAEISSMAVSNTEENLILSIKVDGAFTDKMKEAVLSGISTSFSYVITLTQTRTLLPDKLVHEIKLTNTIRYDTLRNTFTVRRSWENYRPLTTSSFAEAKRWMSEVIDVPIIPLEALENDIRYKINAKAELDRVTLPYFLNYVFFFISLWDFETSWHSVDFIY